MSSYAKILSLAYNSATATKTTALKTYWRSVRLLKEAGTENPGKPSYMTNVLLNGKCVDPETRCLYVFYIDTYFGSAWIIEINIDTRVQTVVYYDKYNEIGFSSLYKFYNARVSHGKLVWTDNLNPIYQMDIQRAKESFYHQIGYGQYPETTEWSPVVSYRAGQNVSDGNYLYKAVVDNYNVVPRWDGAQTTWKYLCRVEEAYYSMKIENFYFEAMPPKMPPVVAYKSDETRKINSLRQVLYQFAYRYVYMDWRRSTFSPASTVPIPQAEEEVTTGLANEQIALNNKLDITINSGGEEVRAIEIIGRSSEDPSKWFLIDTVNKLDESSQISRRVAPAYVPMSISVMPPTVENVSAPDAPVATAATNVLSTSFTANWEASAVGTVYGYYLDVATDSGFTTYVSGYHNRYVDNVLTWEVTGLQAGQAYYYRVRAMGPFNLVSNNSNTITTTTILNAPLAREATDVFGTGFTTNWDASTGATGYYLDVSTDPLFGSFVAGYNNKDVGNVLTSAVVGLVLNTTYYYRVRAYNALTTSVSSNVIDQRTQAPPADVVATAATLLGLTFFTANWNAAVGVTGTYSGYIIDVATDAAFTNILSGYNNRNVGNVTSFAVRLLTPNTRYYYRLKGVNAHGVQSVNWSNTISALTLLPAPVTLAATEVKVDGFTVNWESVTGATGYKIYVSDVADFTNLIVGYDPLTVGAVNSAAITGLPWIATAYYYMVLAFNVDQTSAADNVNSQRLASPTLVAPLATYIDNVTTSGFTAHWDAATGAAGYYIDVSTDNFATFVYQNADAHNFTLSPISGLTSNTRYYFRVRSYDVHGGVSDYSNVLTTYTLLLAPVATEASNITSIGMTANWGPVSGAAGYYLDVSTDPLFGSFVTGYNSLNVGSATSYAINGLTVSTAYYYRVRAYNANGTSAYSNVIDQRTQEPPATVVALPATGNTQFIFYANWEPAVVGTYSGYYLYVATDIGFVNHVSGYNGRDVGNVVTSIVRDLAAGTTYYYRLKAYNAHGVVSVAYSNIITTATNPQLGPDAPVAIAASGIGSYAFTANWNAVAGATGYLLDVSDDARTWRTILDDYNQLNVGNVTSYYVSGLNPSTAYYYRVRAYNANGTSVASNTIYATTLAPPAPSISLSQAMVIFAGSGSAYRVTINVTISNALSWQVNFPSANGYIFNYEWNMSEGWITLYYEGPSPSFDTVEFQANGNDGVSTVVTTFTGRLM